MPITFTLVPDASYFISKYTGDITDEELIRSYKDFFDNQGWTPGLNELVDLSAANMKGVTSDALKELSAFSMQLFTRLNITRFYTAVYAPKDLDFGLAKIYDASTYESPESVKVFRDLQEAKRWLVSRGG